MQTSIQTSFCYNTRNYQNRPSFGSIHVTRYFVKWDDGHFYQATETAVIKDLQRQIVSMLNKNRNNRKRGIKPPAKPSKAWIKKNELKNRLVKFFINRDTDYARRDEVRAFSRYNSNNKPENYILTGKHVVIADNEGKKIGRVTRKSKEKIEEMSYNYGMTYEEAEKILEAENKADVKSAKLDYFDTVEAEIRRVLAMHNREDSPFDAFFIAKKKGEKFIYELVDAKINGK